MKLGSLFSGIGGFDAGFYEAGFDITWMVEKEPFCQAVLKTHFPGVKLFSDVKEVGKHNLEPVDVIAGGFPCQDLSVAGKRAGLEGSRSGLFWEVIRITRELRPRYLVLENVPGLFSSNGGLDFATVLRELGRIGIFQSIAWTVLDSRFFRVAQRRRRVFIVCGLAIGSAEEILFEPEGSARDIAESAEAGTGVTAESTDSTRTVGGGGGEHYVSRALANASSGYRYDPNGEEYVVASPLTRGSGVTGNPPGRRQEDDTNIVIAPLKT